MKTYPLLRLMPKAWFCIFFLVISVASLTAQQSGNVAYVSMKQGASLVGWIESETADTVVLRTNHGTYRLAKSDIGSMDTEYESSGPDGVQAEPAAGDSTKTSLQAVERDAEPQEAAGMTYRFTLKDGRTIVGRVLSETDDNIRIAGEKGKIFQCPKSYVDSRVIVPQLTPPVTVHSARTERDTTKAASDSVVTIFLRDNMTVIGTIVEWQRDSAFVRTAYGPVIIPRNKISRIEMNNLEPATRPAPGPEGVPVIGRSRPGTYISSQRTSRRNSAVLFGGIALPIGDFASTTGTSAGNAKMGFDAGFQWYVGSDYVQFSLAGIFAYNSCEISSTSSYGGYTASVEAGHWMSLWGLGGLRFSSSSLELVQVHGDLMIGALFGFSPEIKATVSGYNPYTGGSYSSSATQESQSGIGLGYGASLGFTISQFDMTIRYLSGKPKYDVTASGSSGSSAKGEFEQPTGIFAFTIGICF